MSKDTSLILMCMIYCLGCGAQERSYDIHDYGGEVMQYEMKYGLFNIGSATISCMKDPGGCGNRIKAEAQSDGLVKFFRNLHYLLECCYDPATGLPNSALRSLKDRRNYLYNELIFDYYSRSDSAIILSQMSGKQIVSKNILDVLTGFYHFRMNYLNDSDLNGEEVVIKTYYTDRRWDLRIRYAGMETIKTNYGEIECYKCNPVTVVGKFFRHEDDMTIWFTKDEFSTPVRIRINLKIGSIVGELVSYQRPQSLP